MADPVAALVARVLRIEPPPSWMVFAVVLVSYFMIVSGVVYDIIVEPPAIGQAQDPRTGMDECIHVCALLISTTCTQQLQGKLGRNLCCHIASTGSTSWRDSLPVSCTPLQVCVYCVYVI